jgi:hypothetical protein
MRRSRSVGRSRTALRLGESVGAADDSEPVRQRSPGRWVFGQRRDTPPNEMRLPVIHARMKQWHLEASIRVGNFSAVGFVQIAARTGPCQIVELRMATAQAWHHMLDVKCGTLQGLVHTAVFTPPCSSDSTCRSISLRDVLVACAPVIAGLWHVPATVSR